MRRTLLEVVERPHRRHSRRLPRETCHRKGRQQQAHGPAHPDRRCLHHDQHHRRAFRKQAGNGSHCEGQRANLSSDNPSWLSISRSSQLESVGKASWLETAWHTSMPVYRHTAANGVSALVSCCCKTRFFIVTSMTAKCLFPFLPSKCARIQQQQDLPVHTWRPIAYRAAVFCLGGRQCACPGNFEVNRAESRIR